MILCTKNKNRGFTLIELLVVIAIIGILSSVILANMSSARSKALDTKRKSDLVQLRNAIETYFIDNGSYPSTNSQWYGVSVNGGSRTVSGANEYIPGLTPKYISKLPTDPRGDTSGWSGFLYNSDGVIYKILIHANGPESFPASGQVFYDPQRPTWSWMLCSGEPACSSW